MKKLSILIAGLSFLFPAIASAATFVVTPSSGSYTAGNTITLNISVNPAGSTIYTAMLDARFSPSNFEVVSFTLNDALLPLKSSGYDALDNAGGVITKTGGYTGGITSTTAFGTLVLRAKTSGTGTFTVADSSKLLDGNSADQQAGTQTFSYVIAQATPVAQTTQPTTTTKPVTKQSDSVKPSTTKIAPAVADAVQQASSTQGAAVATAGTTGNFSWVVTLLAVLAAFGVGYFMGLKDVFGLKK